MLSAPATSSVDRTTGNGLSGATSFVAHLPETRRTAFFVSTNDSLSFGEMVAPVFDAMLAEAGAARD